MAGRSPPACASWLLAGGTTVGTSLLAAPLFAKPGRAVAEGGKLGRALAGPETSSVGCAVMVPESGGAVIDGCAGELGGVETLPESGRECVGAEAGPVTV